MKYRYRASVQPRSKSSRTLAGTVTNSYSRCSIALRVAVPAWVLELWNEAVLYTASSSIQLLKKKEEKNRAGKAFTTLC